MSSGQNKLNNFIIQKNSNIPLLHGKMFTGVGSQKTPPVYREFMAAISYVLGVKGYGLRSGRARGADNFFEIGVPAQMRDLAEIYLPKKGFGVATGCRSFEIEDANVLMEAMYIIDKNNIHEAWQHLINKRGDSFAVAAHTRNVFQCLGIVLRAQSLSKFLICWTPCGSKTFEETTEFTGGTRTAIRLADVSGIPVFNLAVREDAVRLHKMILEFKKHNPIPFEVPTIRDLEPYFTKRKRALK
ncbi:hypothetical protein OTK49_01455 [Vibrio coralliirubri]|uniref:hypothetical protein n=1 Tax=Vibrio coralliirubri TaxID=1516159 RepID=UPI0022851FB5|nr:hypothetical protein [Vibrio coralliirubri]MCY9861191.1 hypothetical protein [Vibrio coralliirubri]